MKIIMYTFLIAVISGCATNLETFNHDGSVSKGIPVPKPRLVKVIKTTYFKAIKAAKNPELCNDTKISETYDYVTSDEYYYVNFDPSQFANGKFDVTFNDKGLASNISINSEASTGVDSINSILGTLLPYYKVPKLDELAAEKSDDSSTSNRLIKNSSISAKDLKAASCIEKKIEIKLEPISVM
ncbi:hypothetical protein [Colwellia sp. 20A7]|uniref:hypothetical protein n=1 Tax=Colwellia sp. 20A7 TaxID=2689569 RepID=UPI0013587B73|nr:hypothetical protein [Colwellia sp. 20A7]